MKILYTGYFDRGNLGDNAMRDATVAHLKSVHPEWEISQVPFPAVRVRTVRKFAGFLRSIQVADVLVINGGTYFHDRFGLRSLRILLSFLVIDSVARLTKTRVLFAGIGIGRLSKFWSQLVVRRLVKTADVTMVRDEGSRTLLGSLGAAGRVVVGGDTALLMRTTVSEHRPLRIIGVSLGPHFESELEGNLRAPSAVASALAKLGSDDDPLTVRIFVFSQADWGHDRDMSAQLAAQLTSLGVANEMVDTQDATMMLRSIAECRAMFAVRYHAFLLAQMAGVAAVAYPYEEKTRFVCEELGLNGEVLLSASEVLDAAPLSLKLQAALTHPDRYRANGAALKTLEARARAGLDAVVAAIESGHR